MHRKPRVTGDHLSWFNRKIEKSNCCCLYCGKYFALDGSTPSDKEHLIGRNFVPEGSLDQGFNFTFRACVSCNKRKAAAEGHVSAVTLLNSSAREESAINELAERKGSKEFRSRLGSMPVKDALETTIITGNLFGASISFTLAGPQQLIPSDVKEVALSHIQGLFALLTSSDYQDPNELRLLPEDQFYLHGFYPESDWGNVHLVELAQRTLALECAANIVSANGFFRALLKRTNDGFFWALEWNKQLRLVGGITTQQMSVFSTLPDHAWIQTPKGRTRLEIPTSPLSEQLFHSDLNDCNDFERTVD